MARTDSLEVATALHRAAIRLLRAVRVADDETGVSAPEALGSLRAHLRRPVKFHERSPAPSKSRARPCQSSSPISKRKASSPNAPTAKTNAASASR